MDLDKPMIIASKLPERYGIGKSLFYQRRSYLKSLGYNVEPEKDGNRRKYSDEQIKLLDELDRYILQNGGMEGFPPANASAKTHPSQKPAQEIENKNGSTKRPSQRGKYRDFFQTGLRNKLRNIRGNRPDSGH